MSLATMLKIYLLYATFRRTEGIAVVPSRAHLRAASLHAPPSGRPALSLVDLGLQLEDCPVDVTWGQLLAREPECADWEGRGLTDLAPPQPTNGEIEGNCQPDMGGPRHPVNWLDIQNPA